MRMDSDAWPLESRGRKEGVEGRRGGGGGGGEGGLMANSH